MFSSSDPLYNTFFQWREDPNFTIEHLKQIITQYNKYKGYRRMCFSSTGMTQLQEYVDKLNGRYSNILEPGDLIDLVIILANRAIRIESTPYSYKNMKYTGNDFDGKNFIKFMMQQKLTNFIFMIIGSMILLKMNKCFSGQIDVLKYNHAYIDFDRVEAAFLLHRSDDDDEKKHLSNIVNNIKTLYSNKICKECNGIMFSSDKKTTCYKCILNK